MNVVICDDESVYIQTLEKAIMSWARQKDLNHAVSIMSFSSGEELLESLQDGKTIDALFIDIQFRDEENGISIVKEIHKHSPNLPVAFITNYGEYVYEGYRVNALRFLRKPISQYEIDECMDIIWHQYQVSQKESILFRTQSQTLCYPAGFIMYIEALGHRIRIVTTDAYGEYTMRFRFSEAKRILPAETFSQCHRSFIVNIQFVRCFTNKSIFMSNGDTIPVGRIYAMDFVHTFQAYYQGSVRP